MLKYYSFPLMQRMHPTVIISLIATIILALEVVLLLGLFTSTSYFPSNICFSSLDYIASQFALHA